MNIIIIDKRTSFLADIQTRLLVDDREIELVGQSSSSSNILKMLETSTPEYLLIADNVLDEQEDWIFPNCVTVGYVTALSENNPFDARGIPSYGLIRSTTQLLDALEQGIPKKPNLIEQTKVSKQTNEEHPADEIESVLTEVVDKSKNDAEFENVTEIEPEPVQSVQEDKDSAPISIRERLRAANEERAQAKVKAKLKGESDIVLKETRVVTVYSAKGGVGKTTVSTELATCLSRTSVGRGFLRVCIVDCNIDFGDVLMTLGYDVGGPNLSLWAAEVKERIDKGESPKSIKFTKTEVEARLQKKAYSTNENDESGLFALVAPLTHEDSMDIDGEAFEVIMDNIIKNGDFDFVICDTGNNTRDTSITALEKSHDVFMVVTQDINAAGCNALFLSTVQKLGFDINKIKLVINNIIPSREASINIKELEEEFEKFDCIAHINRSTEVIKANNLAEPLVLTSTEHQFSQEIQKIASYLTGYNYGYSNRSKKQSLFSKIFKK